MKKLLAFLTALILFASTVFSQDSILLHVQYKPETRYNLNIEQSSKMELKYIGSEAFLNRLETQKIANPTIKNTVSIVEAALITSKLTDSIHFPIRMEFIKMTNTDGSKAAISDGTVIFGQTTINGMPSFDSISSNGMKEEFKTMFLQSMKKMFFTFPNKYFKIGETCITKSPISMPISGVEIAMDITTNYKLMNISDGKAYFDISQIYTMSSASSTTTIAASGDGKGQFVYDIAQEYYLQYDLGINMEMKMKMENMEIDLKMENNSKQTVDIKKN